jgi:hypothetical protein
MTTAWILVGCVAAIGVVVVLMRRGVLGAKAEDTSAGSAKQ